MSYASYGNLGKDPTIPTESEMVELPEIKSEEDRINLLRNYRVVVIDNYTTWCGPCKIVAPHFAKLAKDIAAEYPFVIFAKEDAGLEIDGAPEIRGVPCFHFYVNGNLVKDATCTGGSIDPVKEKLMNIIKYMVQ